MATEIHREPAAAREPLTMSSATDRLSSILNSGAEEVPEAPAEEISEPEAPTAAPEAHAEEPQGEEPSTEAEPSETQESGEEPESIELETTQLATLLGVDEGDLVVNDDGAVRFRVRIDGEQTEMSLRDVREGYRLAKISDQRLSKLGEERQAFEQERSQALETLANQHQRLNQTIEQLENDYASGFEAVDWARLREEDPTEYNAKRLDFEDRRRRLESQRAQAQSQAQELQGQYVQQVQKFQEDGKRRLNETFEGAAYANAPAWDEGERKRLHDWVVGQGFTPEQISQVHAWQLFKWARDSMLREEELTRARETERKVKKLPKVIKPGQAKSQRDVSRGKVSDLKVKQRKSGGDLRSSTELIRGIINSGS